ncbi:MAG: hypothetical protein V3S30_01480 [Thermoanaerobaculia bacterium]
MFRNLRVRREPQKFAPDPLQLSIDEIISDAAIPVSIRSINNLPDNAKRRLYRALIPIGLLTRFRINPRSWLGPDGDARVDLFARPESGLVNLSVWNDSDRDDPFFTIELEDNSLNGIDLNLLVLSDPDAPRFQTDFDETGARTEFGTVRRNLGAEEQAMRAGLAPGQTRAGLRASSEVFSHLESFLTLLAHHAYFLEPLSYASAWVFERRGFAYVRGHKLMDQIHEEFQPEGRLYQKLDEGTPFRTQDQWRSVRGRAWAIHDGILDVLDARWDGLRMIKQVGRHAGAETFPGAEY